MINTLLPRDSQGSPIPVLGYRKVGSTSKRQTLTSTADGATTGLSAEIEASIITVYSTQDCYMDFGTANDVRATSSDFFLPAGIEKDIAIKTKNGPEYLYMSVATISSQATVYISERV